MTFAHRLNVAIHAAIAAEPPHVPGTVLEAGSAMMWDFLRDKDRTLALVPTAVPGNNGIPMSGVRFGWHKDGAWVVAPTQEMTVEDFSEVVLDALARGATFSRPDETLLASVDKAEIAARALETLGYAEAEVRSDHFEVVVQIDARPYLARASEADLIALWANDWRGGDAGDKVQETAEKRRDPAAERITAYLDGAKGEIGFEVIADEEMMMDWLREFRPDAHATVMVKEFQRKHDLPEPGVLDELVHDAAEKIASRANNESLGDRDEASLDAAGEIAAKVNNEGSEAQIRFLVLNGYTLNTIDAEIENHDPGFY